MPSPIDHACLRAAVRLAGAAVLLMGLAACVPPPAQFPPVEAVAPPATPDRIVELTVYFAFDSHTIEPESYPTLDNVVRALNDHRLAGYHFDINGHTDIIGRLSYNIALSNLRAAAVVDYLAIRGIPREFMRPQGFGPLQLLDPANPASPANRRVEIVSVR
jgi:outer membrane protein OmpA-like peptidoglycan-associated protein